MRTVRAISRLIALTFDLTFTPNLRADTQLRFSLHFTPLGISFCPIVSQPFAFLVLER